MASGDRRLRRLTWFRLTWFRLTWFAISFGLLFSSAMSQTIPNNSEHPARAAASTSEEVAFTDVTATLGINFEYVASHTTKKYLIETKGVWRSALRLRQ